MPLNIEGLRFDLRNSTTQEIADALHENGHVVIDNVWNKHYLQKLYNFTSERYNSDDKKYEGNFDKYPNTTIDSYLGNHLDFEQLCHQAGGYDANIESMLFEEFEKTGLQSIFRALLKGPFFFGRSERVVRRADPKFKLRFTGLHADGQLGACSNEGINSKDEYTLWTPLVDCTDDLTPRLLLLHKEEKIFNDLFENELINKGDSSQHSLVQLRPYQIIDEKKFLEKNQEEIYKSFEKLFIHKQCFAPYVPLGSVVIFDRKVVHGTYINKLMNKPRYSLDCRFTGVFKITKLNRMFSGRLYPNNLSYPNSRIHRIHTFINNQKQKIINIKNSSKFIKVFGK